MSYCSFIINDFHGVLVNIRDVNYALPGFRRLLWMMLLHLQLFSYLQRWWLPPRDNMVASPPSLTLIHHRKSKLHHFSKLRRKVFLWNRLSLPKHLWWLVWQMPGLDIDFLFLDFVVCHILTNLYSLLCVSCLFLIKLYPGLSRRVLGPGDRALRLFADVCHSHLCYRCIAEIHVVIFCQFFSFYHFLLLFWFEWQ